MAIWFINNVKLIFTMLNPPHKNRLKTEVFVVLLKIKSQLPDSEVIIKLKILKNMGL
jgi:hypothetical protein